MQTCEQCGTEVPDLAAHMLEAHPDAEGHAGMECTICGTQVGSDEELKAHMQEAHADEGGAAGSDVPPADTNSDVEGM